MSKSPTYVYRDFGDNLIVGANLLDKLRKVERWRLVNEGSEDALSWNVFVSLAKLRLLHVAFKLVTGFEPREEPELYLWGNRVEAQTSYFWEKLCEVRRKLENGLTIPTEPDIILRVPREAIVLIEAKFGSGNGTLGGNAKRQRFGEGKQFLERYRALPERVDPLNREWIECQEPKNVLEQLCRNVIFAHWLAEGGEEPWVVNLVRECSEKDVEDRMREHLAPKSPVKLHRATWEDIYDCLLKVGNVGAKPLQHYMENKTLRLERAFNLQSAWRHLTRDELHERR